MNFAVGELYLILYPMDLQIPAYWVNYTGTFPIDSTGPPIMLSDQEDIGSVMPGYLYLVNSGESAVGVTFTYDKALFSLLGLSSLLLSALL